MIKYIYYTVTVLAFLATCTFANEAKPNFVFIITDDIGTLDIGPYGNKFVKTPHLDLMAQQGLVFDNAYNTISSCSPSRCSIITGRYPHNTGAPELFSTLPKDQNTFMKVLQDAGYYTLLAGKNHMGDAKDLGFDVFENVKPAGSENWEKHLKERPKDQPFFFWFATHDAHHAWQINDKAPVYDPADVPVPPMLYDGPLTREELANYYHEVSRTDYYTGSFIEALKTEGIYDNTYIIYCSDNGRPLPRCKSYLYESGTQTPLIITGPGILPARVESLVSSIDYSATFLELAGLAVPDSIQGVSFSKILSNPKLKIRDVVFAERNWHVFALHERMVRMGEYLYIWNAWPNQHNVVGESACFVFPAVRELWDAAETGKLNLGQLQVTLGQQPEEMLFNVKNDPMQFNNLADKPRYLQTLKKFRSLLSLWKAQTGDSVPQNPTKNRQPLHERRKLPKDFSFGEFPGVIHNATTINHKGPVALK